MLHYTANSKSITRKVVSYLQSKRRSTSCRRLKKFSLRRNLIFAFFISSSFALPAQKLKTKLIRVDSGWARNSINTVVFRKNSLVSFGNWQYIAYYDRKGFVVLGKRKLNDAKWELEQTPYKGNTSDAHNAISIMADGEGYLHIAWDHHNNALHYARSKRPGLLELTEEMQMTGKLESNVSYPEFYRMPDGDLIFFYRDGSSGNGNLVMNRYDLKTKSWKQLQRNLIDGEGQRNAYWQACVDAKGWIHVSWVWRESPDVASNHDLCYALSKDGGISWQKSTGELYELPITAAGAEYAVRIPQKSELINQTSMVADEDGVPYIATYWREQASAIPQYHLVYKTKEGWKKEVLDFRRTSFTLSGRGTKRIPISRPQIVAWKTKSNLSAAIIFRDEERGSKVSAAINKNLGKDKWMVVDLTTASVGLWEPTYDTELWKAKSKLHLFIQNVQQEEADAASSFPPQMIEVMECDLKKSIK